MQESDTTIDMYRFPRLLIVTSLLYVVPEADAKQVVAAPTQAMQKNIKIYFGKELIFSGTDRSLNINILI